jgi:PAS domain S-box-containing protein
LNLFAKFSLPRLPVRFCAFAATTIGILVLIGWALDISGLKSVFPGLVTMKANTALGIVLCGLALALLTRPKISDPARYFAGLLGLVSIFLGSLSLSEDILGWDLGIDQWLVKDLPASIESSSPGRMSPATAFAFLLLGSTLILASARELRGLRAAAVSALSAVVVAIGCMSISGYLLSGLFNFHFWNYTGMAVHSALVFILLGFGFLDLVRRKGDGPVWSLDRLTTAGFLIGVISLVSSSGESNNHTSKLVEAASWVAHTQEVLKDIEKIEFDVAALGSSQREFVNSGIERSLGGFEQAKASLKLDLSSVRRLTTDNQSQQRRLDRLELLIAERIKLGREIIAARREQGLAGAEQMITNGTTTTSTVAIRKLIQDMEDEEYSLLAKRQKTQGAIITTTFLLLPLGAFLSLTILSLGLFFLNAGLSERKRLERTNSLLAAIVESSDDAIVGKDLKGIVTSWNAGAETVFGYAASEMIGRPISLLIPQDRIHEEIEILDRIRLGKNVHHFETVRQRKDGDLIDVSVTVSPIKDLDGRVMGASKVARDITDRKRADLRLNLQYAVTAVLAEGDSLERTNQKILETLALGLRWDLGELWVVDRNTQVLRCAEIWYPNSTGFRDFANLTRSMTFSLGKGLPGHVWESKQPEWCADIINDPRCARQGPASRLQLREWIGFPIELHKEILGVIGFFSAKSRAPDPELLSTMGAIGSQLGQFIEARQQAEQFRQAQKMEAIGTLAGGIAHDFNNILSGIVGYTELMKMDNSLSPRLDKYADEVMKAGGRATKLVRQILLFSRHEQAKREVIQLGAVVEEAVRFLRATIPSTIEFKVELPSNISPVLADSTQIHQIVMNLCTNASHAMSERSGRLEVRLEQFTVDTFIAGANSDLRSGQYVRLSVSDTGHGMDPATQSRIFDPFFTTKAPGVGTGLGLSVVHGIVKSHDGAITVKSQLGEGTTFQLYFPVHSEVENVVITDTAAPIGHGQQILFVDDEKPLALLGQIILENLGYRVESTTSVHQALALVEANPTRFDLIITDLAMPEISGIDFAKRLIEIRPDLPVILATGYTASLTNESVQKMGMKKLLLKPHSTRSLGTAAYEVLEASSRARSS